MLTLRVGKGARYRVGAVARCLVVRVPYGACDVVGDVAACGFTQGALLFCEFAQNLRVLAVSLRLWQKQSVL